MNSGSDSVHGTNFFSSQHRCNECSATFETKNAKGQIVNRTMGIASVGSAAIDNEECWIYQALLRAAGLVYIEHQARI